ncbi:hypothetical protein YC2023_004687 [Brassica napus]
MEFVGITVLFFDEMLKRNHNNPNEHQKLEFQKDESGPRETAYFSVNHMQTWTFFLFSLVQSLPYDKSRSLLHRDSTKVFPTI